MNQAERDEIGMILTELSVAYDHDLPKERASIFINVLIKYFPQYGFDDFKRALTAYAFDKNVKFPSPMQLKTYLENRLSRDSEANAVAAAIRRAVSDHGWSAPDKAHAQMGDLAWKIVNDMGGWLYICENLGVDLNPATFFAQTRDVAKSYLEREEKISINENQIGFQDKNVLNMPIKTLTKEK